MALPWHTLETVDTADGPLQLRQRGEREFLILLSNRVLMNSHHNRSELAVADRACRALAALPSPRLLIGGLGMGCTLRAALDVLPATARVRVAELHPVIERWCREPLAVVNDRALEDPRVEVEIADVSAVIARHAERSRARFDAIVLDLYEGPHAQTDPRRDPFYGHAALQRSHGALTPGGHLAVWSEAVDRGFEGRLRQAGFAFERIRPGKGGLRHAVYLARGRSDPTGAARPARRRTAGQR